MPVGDNGLMEEEVNKFLGGHKILEMVHEFSSNDNGAAWHLCIKYLETFSFTGSGSYTNYKKVDYKNVLDEKSFRVFCKNVALVKSEP